MRKERDVYVVAADERIPFLRGMVTHSLVMRGLKFSDAYEIATLVRKRIERLGEIRKEALSQLIEQAVRDRLGDIQLADAKPAFPKDQTIEVVHERVSFPFSKGILSQSLQASGLDPTVAYEVARRIETRLLRASRESITRQELRELIYQTILKTQGSQYAERYLLWRRFRSPDKPIIVAFGGATGTGKSSLATEVAYRLAIRKILSTDTVRQIMRMMFSAELLPSIHHSSYEAWKDQNFLHFSRSRVVDAFEEQASKVCTGVKAMIVRAVEENISLVIDGVHLVPGLIDYDVYAEGAYIVPVVITTLNRAKYRERFLQRQSDARNRQADRYLANFDSILEIQDYIIEMAERYRIPIIENVDFEESVLSILSLITSTLKEKFKTAELASHTSPDLKD
ncbi:MAG: 2-phosphoglycerate kinase [Acidobacteria bacterium]|nr:2-phosphoglycerate kinase [Acidobacteriota bacterium]